MTQAYFYILRPPLGCECPEGYTLDEYGNCNKTDTYPAVIRQSSICVARSTLPQYGSSGARIYNEGYTNTLVGPYVDATSDFWRGLNGETSPMNKTAIWVGARDANGSCTGQKATLASGQVIQFSYQIAATAENELIHLGIGGDNTFRIILNGTQLVYVDMATSAGGLGPTANFNFWHIIPIRLRAGLNTITVAATGDQTTNDALGAIVYRNATTESLVAATADNQLEMVFRTDSLLASNFDIVEPCNEGYELITIGGPGNYVCSRTLREPCQ